VQPKKLKVTAIQGATIAPDGSGIEIALKGEGDATVTLAFSAEGLETFTGQATQMVALAQNQRQAGSAQLGIRATEVLAASVVVPAEGGKVILRLQAPSGLIYAFALSPGLAEQLRPELLRTAYAARGQATAMKQ
jgi:hypothetical protein